MGIEPTYTGTTIRGLDRLATLAVNGVTLSGVFYFNAIPLKTSSKVFPMIRKLPLNR